MNKKTIIAIVVVIILLIGAYFIFGKKSNVSPDTTTTQDQTSSPTSLKDLLSKGLAQSCTFSNENSSGTVYVSSGKVRGDFSTTMDTNVTKSHMIVDGNTSYIWTDGSATGFKMTVDSAEASPSSEPATPVGSFDANANMNYKCSTWLVDSSMFILPTDVKFTSFDSLIAPVGSSAPVTGSNASQCSYCDSLSGDSKTQCLTALKCN